MAVVSQVHNRTYTEQCVLDAGGSPTDRVEQIAWERLKQAGIPITSTNAIVTELIKVSSTFNATREGH